MAAPACLGSRQPLCQAPAGLLALGVNLTVTVAGTLVCRWFGVRDGVDVTGAGDYLADEGDPTIHRMAELIDGPQRYQPRHSR